MRGHAWCHAVFRMEYLISSHGNKNLHKMRCGISQGIHTQVYMTHVILHDSRLSRETSLSQSLDNPQE